MSKNKKNKKIVENVMRAAAIIIAIMTIASLASFGF